MKKLITSLFLLVAICGTFSLHAASKKSPSHNSVKLISTTLVALNYDANGWLWQVAYYSDGIVFTSAAGPYEGCQVVTINGATFDANCNFSVVNGIIVHRYTWGEVRSTEGYQEIKFY